jgi:hypothetical protein
MKVNTANRSGTSVVPKRATAKSYIPTDFAVTSVRLQQRTNVVLTWINGTQPFQPQVKMSILSEWMDFGPSTTLRQITNPAPLAKAFFRVRSGNTPPDLSPPVANLTAPANGSTVSNITTLTATATDDVGVTKVEFYLDGSVLIGTDTTAPYSLLLDTAPIPNGTHFLSCKAYDASGKTGNSTFSIVTVNNFSPYVGACVWSKSFGGTSGKSGIPRDIPNPVRVAVGPDNSIVMAGYFSGSVNFGGVKFTSAGASDIFVAKYTAAGQHVWSKRFGATVSDQADAIAVDASTGDVVITGEFMSTVEFGGTSLTAVGASVDIFLVRLSSANGAVQWAKRFGNSTGDFGKGLAIDNAGAITLTGYFEGTLNVGGSDLVSAGLSDVLLAKFTGTGGHVWSKRFGGPQTDKSVGVALDGSGNAIVAGEMAGTVDFGGGPLTSAGASDIFVAKYNAAGVHVFARLYGGANSQRPVSLVANASGQIALVGNFVGSVDFGTGIMVNTGEQDIFIAKLAADGDGLWSRSIGFPDDTIPTFSAWDVALDHDGNVLLASTVITGLNGQEGSIRKFASASGLNLWEKPVTGVGPDGANALATDTQGNTIAAGYFYDTVNFGCGPHSATGFTDAFLLKLTP